MLKIVGLEIPELKITSRRKSNGRWYVRVEALNGYSWETYYSRLVVEVILRKALPSKVVIHHVNEDKLDDSPNNLVACEDEAFHNLLHLRTKALRATGDPHSRQCKICKQWNLPGEDMTIYRVKNFPNGVGEAVHKSCRRKG